MTDHFYRAETEILKQAEILSKRLSVTGSSIAMTTLLAIMLSFASMLVPMVYRGTVFMPRYEITIMLMGLAGISFVSISVIIIHEVLVKRAISFQSYLADVLQDFEESRSSKQDREIKYAVRVLSRAGDLPLFPGRFGPAAYASINVVLLFLAISMSARYF